MYDVDFSLDFFAYENGQRSTVTMGLATVGGVCLDQYACVIAEFGTTNVFGKPYPSAGFTSVYIMAHEVFFCTVYCLRRVLLSLTIFRLVII